MSDADSMITPPPGVPKREPVVAKADAPAESITLPPEIADSGTLRSARSRENRPPMAQRREIVFHAAPLGVPVEVEPVELEPESAELEPVGSGIVVLPPVDALAPLPSQVVPDDAGETVVSTGRRAAGWRLVLEGGAAFTVAGFAFLGRDPSATPDRPGASEIPLDDPSKSVSKTHALVEAAGTTLWITDLNSTNGTWVIRADGSETAVEGGARVAVEAGDTVELGDLVVRVEHS